ncbi:MAG: hypothetical protein ACOC6P_01365 [Candidatus Aminicenantaceae bacterium]
MSHSVTSHSLYQDIFLYTNVFYFYWTVRREDPSGDSCWVTDSYIGGARKSNTVVSLTLDKDKHFSSEGRGQKKWVSAQFFTGYIQEGTPKGYLMSGLKQADTTMKVRLGYIR